MKPFRSGLTVAAAVIAFSAAAQQPAPASGKIGFISTERVLHESRTTQKLRQELEDEFQKRVKEIDDGPRDQVERRMIALDEEMGLRREDALRQFVDKTNRIMRHIAMEENFDAVFLEAAYFSTRVDLTDKVIKELDAAQ